MFFHHDLLRKRGRPLSIIWLEALTAKPFKVTRRQALRVNVRRTCSEIVDVVHYRARDKKGKKKKYSLYLSAHLMYGVVSIWRKQVTFLLDDAKEMQMRVLVGLVTPEKIDLQHLPRMDHINVHDAVSKTNEEDPFFGSLKHFFDHWDRFVQEAVIPPSSPSAIISSPPGWDSPPFQPEMGSPHQAPKSSITLRELPYSTSPLIEVPIPGDTDLPLATDQEVELISEQPGDMGDMGDVTITMQDLIPDPAITARLLQRHTSSEDGEKTPEKAAPEKVGGRQKGEKKKRKRMADDDLDRTVDEQTRPKRPVREQDTSFQLEPIAGPLPPRRGPRPRQLFVDTVTEIAKADIRGNFATTGAITRPFEVARIQKKDTPAQLLKTPGSSGIAKNPMLRHLWERNLQTKESDSDIELSWHLPEHDDGDRRRFPRRRQAGGVGGSAAEDSSQDDVRVLPHGEEAQPVPDVPVDLDQAMTGDGSSMEAAREGSLSRSRTPQHSSLHTPGAQSPMEASLSSTGHKGQAERSRGRSKRRGGSSEGGSSLSSGEEPSLPPLGTSGRLGVLPEEIEEGFVSPPHPPRPLDSSQEIALTSPQIRFIQRCEDEGAWGCTTFHAMCPPKSYNKVEAADCFMALLEQCSQGSLFVKQRSPYGEIYISTEPRFLPQSPA